MTKVGGFGLGDSAERFESSLTDLGEFLQAIKIANRRLIKRMSAGAAITTLSAAEDTPVFILPHALLFNRTDIYSTGSTTGKGTFPVFRFA